MDADGSLVRTFLTENIGIGYHKEAYCFTQRAMARSKKKSFYKEEQVSCGGS